MNYETLLREHNLKVTPQRLGILSLMQTMGHINIEELYTQIKVQFSSISLATLYKNINAMVANRLITEVKVPNVKSKYEITKDPHIHLLCDTCNEFIDLDLDINPLLNEASSKSHYELYGSCIVLSGVCEKCQEKV